MRKAISASSSRSADPSEIPVQRLRGRDGAWIRIPLDFPGRTMYLRAWVVNVGRLSLYLLDSNDPANAPSTADHGRLYEESGSAMAAGDRARLRRLALVARTRPRSRGLSPQRRTCGLRRARASALDRAQRRRAVRGGVDRRAGRDRVHDAHTGRRAFDRFDPSFVAAYLSRYAAEISRHR